MPQIDLFQVLSLIAIVEISEQEMSKKSNDGKDDSSKIYRPVRIRHPKDIRTDGLAEAFCYKCAKFVTVYRKDSLWYCPHCSEEVVGYEGQDKADRDPDPNESPFGSGNSGLYRYPDKKDDIDDERYEGPETDY